VRAPKEKLRDIRAAIHKLLIGCIEMHEREKYITSLNGRINHIERICERDARPLKLMLQRALSGPIKSVTPKQIG
jgi:hypothetical protein